MTGASLSVGPRASGLGDGSLVARLAVWYGVWVCLTVVLNAVQTRSIRRLVNGNNRSGLVRALSKRRGGLHRPAHLIVISSLSVCLLAWVLSAEWSWFDFGILMATGMSVLVLQEALWRGYDPMWTTNLSVSVPAIAEIVRRIRGSRREAVVYFIRVIAIPILTLGALIALAVMNSSAWTTGFTRAQALALLSVATFAAAISSEMLTCYVLASPLCTEPTRVRLAAKTWIVVAMPVTLAYLAGDGWKTLRPFDAMLSSQASAFAAVAATVLLLPTIICSLIGSLRRAAMTSSLLDEQFQIVRNTVRVITDEDPPSLNERLTAARGFVRARRSRSMNSSPPASPLEVLQSATVEIFSMFSEAEENPRPASLDPRPDLSERSSRSRGDTSQFEEDVDAFVSSTAFAEVEELFASTQTKLASIRTNDETWTTRTGWLLGLKELLQLASLFEDLSNAFLVSYERFISWARAPRWIHLVVFRVLSPKRLRLYSPYWAAYMRLLIRDLEDMPERDPRWQHRHQLYRLNFILTAEQNQPATDSESKPDSEIIGRVRERLNDEQERIAHDQKQFAETKRIPSRYLTPLLIPLIMAVVSPIVRSKMGL
jgi:hypothetical protein